MQPMFDKEQKRKLLVHFEHKKARIRDSSHKIIYISSSIPFTNRIYYAAR